MWTATRGASACWVSLALCWATLYAFAVGAAAFAGERETGTLRLLDTLPAPRRVVWASKVSFAFLTTLALTATFLLIATLGSDDWQWPARGFSAYRNGFPMVGVLLQALAFGLFCSSIMNSALLAAVSAIVLTVISWMGLAVSLDRYVSGADYDPSEVLFWQLVTALAAVVASHIAFTWARRTGRMPMRLRLRAPIVVSWGESFGRQPVKRGSPDPARYQTAVGRGSPDPARYQTAGLQEPKCPPSLETSGQLVGGVGRPAPNEARAWSADRPRPRSRFTELRFLIGETMWEGRTTWYLLLAIGLIFPMVIALHANFRNLSFAIPWNALVALVAGVSVFGLENRRRTYRFLAHHGARPGAVWLAKLLTWCLGLAIIWVPLVTVHTDLGEIPVGPREGLIWLALCLPLVFAVAQLCGMVIPRGITAGVITLVIAIALGSIQVALVEGMMMPIWGLAAMPVALLAVTWAWSGDWLLDRPAPGRYVRLGLILAATFGVLLGGYAGVRAWGIPDAGPIAEPSVWAATAPLPPDRNAADLYREAARQSHFMMGNVVIRSREVLDLVRKPRRGPTASSRNRAAHLGQGGGPAADEGTR